MRLRIRWLVDVRELHGLRLRYGLRELLRLLLRLLLELRPVLYHLRYLLSEVVVLVDERFDLRLLLCDDGIICCDIRICVRLRLLLLLWFRCGRVEREYARCHWRLRLLCRWLLLRLLCRWLLLLLRLLCRWLLLLCHVSTSFP